MPGLKVVQPSTPHDAKGCLLAAIADPDPVMIFEHKLLYKMKGEVPEGHYIVPLGKARLSRPGSDVTIVATSIMVHRSLAAAEELAREGIEAEVIDLRSLRPLDREALTQSVKRTHRLACVYEGVKTLGIGAELSAASPRATLSITSTRRSSGSAEPNAPSPIIPSSRRPRCRRRRPSSPRCAISSAAGL